MLPSVVYQRFLSEYDQWSAMFENASGAKVIATDLFRRAQIDYSKPLIAQWGRTGIINDEVAPYIETFSVASPSSNQLDISTSSVTLTNYYKIGFINVTIGGVIYTGIPYWNPNDRKSVYSQPTATSPKYDISNNIIQLYPTSSAVTLATGQYCRTGYTIDFDTSTDIPLADDAIESIIQIAMVMADNMLRDDRKFSTDMVINQMEDRVK